MKAWYRFLGGCGLITLILTVISGVVIGGTIIGVASEGVISTSQERSMEDENSSKTRSVVELDIFSGRTNPTWELSNEETATLVGMLASLSSTSPRALPDKLGYSGISVSMTSSVTGTTTRVKAYRGIVRQEKGDEIAFYADLGRRVEQFLVATAKPHIDDSLYVSIAEEAQSGTEQ